MCILAAKSLTKYFGGLAALKSVDFELRENEILGLIGPNGAGKTTLANVISGVYLPTSGEVIFGGQDVTKLPAHIRCRLGIGRTFQIMHPFEDLNLLQNVMVGLLFGRGAGIKEASSKAREICESLSLSQLEKQVSKLGVLEIKKMEIARALATKPKILFLDEVMAGLNIDETKDMIEAVRRIRAQGVTICIVEHVMNVIKALTERVIVLDGGEVIAEGPYDEVSSNPKVISAYLGEED
jgi:branched-chain amino acid transport system ATP-binding protein